MPTGQRGVKTKTDNGKCPANGKNHSERNADASPLVAHSAPRLSASGCQYLFLHTQSIHRVYTLCCVIPPFQGFFYANSVISDAPRCVPTRAVAALSLLEMLVVFQASPRSAPRKAMPCEKPVAHVTPLYGHRHLAAVACVWP